MIEDTKMVGAETVSRDLDVSMPTAYKIIREWNKEIKEKYPSAIIIPGKVNRAWYNNAVCYMDIEKKE